MPEIRIKYFTEEIDKLEYIDGKSDWIGPAGQRRRRTEGRGIQADSSGSGYGASKGL